MTALAVGIIVVMTAICVIGTELSASMQDVLTLFQVAALLAFAAVALIKVYAGDAPEGSLDAGGVVVLAVCDRRLQCARRRAPDRRLHLLGLGERRQPVGGVRGLDARAGRAAIASTIVLLVTYLSVSTAVLAFGGTQLLTEYADDEGIFAVLGEEVLGSPWDKIVVLAIVISAISSTQTTIIPGAARRSRWRVPDAMPRSLRERPPPVPDAARLDDRDGGSRNALVRARELHLGELPLRHALGALADDRVLLRAVGTRLRRLLPAAS